MRLQVSDFDPKTAKIEIQRLGLRGGHFCPLRNTFFNRRNRFNAGSAGRLRLRTAEAVRLRRPQAAGFAGNITEQTRSQLNSTNLQKPERFFYLSEEIVQDLKFQGNSNHFCLFSRICEIFRKFKKEICSRIVGSNFSRHYGVEEP